MRQLKTKLIILIIIILILFENYTIHTKSYVFGVILFCIIIINLYFIYKLNKYK